MGHGVAFAFPSQPTALSLLALLVVACIRREHPTRGASLSLRQNLGPLELNDGGGQLSR